MLGEYLEETRRRAPLIHCITNYVTAGDCANILLACGAAAIMAEDPEEAAEITAQCGGLVLNMGTPHPRKTEALFLSGAEANRLSHPVVLDPVGVGASALRRKTGAELLERIRFAAIRGNASEIAALASGRRSRHGVETDPELSAGREENARLLALETGSVVISTGESDLVTDGRKMYRVQNGHPLMSRISGSGCMLSALLGAWITASGDSPLPAALSAVCAMGLAGEQAFARLSPREGPAACRNHLIDAVFRMTPEDLEKGAKYEAEA